MRLDFLDRKGLVKALNKLKSIFATKKEVSDVSTDVNNLSKTVTNNISNINTNTSNINSHAKDTTRHITASERDSWNDKVNQETLAYNVENLRTDIVSVKSELSNNIYSDSDQLDIADQDGNVIARIDSHGLSTSAINVNGTRFEGDYKFGEASGMPQIRFVGMPCSGWWGQVDWQYLYSNGEYESGFADHMFDSATTTTHEDLCFTIEIVSGRLKEGDQIQICRMAKYGGIWDSSRNSYTHPPKRKLRCLFEYIVRKEDIGRRFITIKVSYRFANPESPEYNRNVVKLFTKQGATTYGMQYFHNPIYFRVRRDSGILLPEQETRTNAAEFSNIEQVNCLSYKFADDKLVGCPPFYKIRIT